ncbi:MAG TPA: TonB-dependent receptor [Rhodanobacter sp.]|nr:TonB-dependent receptor [Rhodanobacter sp.]
MKSNLVSTVHCRHLLQRKALVLAIGSIISGFAGTAWSQATRGTIQGTVPIQANETIQITGGAGFHRTVSVDPSGKYSITLPVGTYTVSLLQNGKVVQSRGDVSPVAGGAVAVDFSSTSGAKSIQNLSGVVVTANAIPPIDVSTTNQVTTITAEQLRQLPLGRSAAAIAMLAPGVNMGSPQLVGGPLGTPINVFGGASTAENAYYIDGMNVTDALTAQGGIELPYGAIEQQQTFISGYGAKYGRSIGGVINQIGKSGSNQWHFGVRAQWEPAGTPWTADKRNYYFANPLETDEGLSPGDLSTYNKGNHAQQTVYDAYVSGPIIKDKLFFFLAAEQDNTSGTTIGSVEDPFAFNYRVHAPKLYAKVDWNINDSNLLTVTGLQSSNKSWQADYNYDYDNLKTGTFSNLDQTAKTAFRLWTANYSSYITDNLTLNAMVGKTRGEYYTQQPGYPGFDPELPHIGSPSVQNPAFVPPGGIVNSQTNSQQSDPTHRVDVTSYRLSLDYKLGDHDIQAGIDNINSWDINDGAEMTGPGYAWVYGSGDPGTPLFGTGPDSPPYVAPSPDCTTGADGKTHCYYVMQRIDRSSASVKVVQRAQYIEDNWQVTPNLLLNLGLRNDQFTNFDGSGVPYIRLTKPQWAPRLGFSWDVHGDSTLKVFGNVGRYYLSLPLTTATSIASPVTATNLYGTYTGIDPTTGDPIGFTPLPQTPSTGVSIDNEYGQPKDPRVSTAQNIQAEFSDNYVLGLQQQFEMLGTKWVASATGTYQRMNRIIDDYDDEQRECAAGVAQGYSWMTPATCSNWSQSLVLINPGVTNDLLMKAPDGSLVPVKFTEADQGFTKGSERRYYSLDLSLAHAWDGKWMAKVDYVFSRTWGNTEGPVSTFSQQSGSYESITTAWDFPERMEWSSGVLPNDRRHQIKVYGAYAINPEWTVGGNLYAASGTPRMCRGGYGPDQLALHGSHTYYWCGGLPVPPGSLGRMPWTTSLGLNVDYKPAWADRKLDFGLAAFNVFNSQQAIFINDFFGTTNNPNSDYGRLLNTQAPRMVRISVAYDF